MPDRGRYAIYLPWCRIGMLIITVTYSHVSLVPQTLVVRERLLLVCSGTWQVIAAMVKSLDDECMEEPLQNYDTYTHRAVA